MRRDLAPRNAPSKAAGDSDGDDEGGDGQNLLSITPGHRLGHSLGTDKDQTLRQRGLWALGMQEVFPHSKPPSLCNPMYFLDVRVRRESPLVVPMVGVSPFSSYATEPGPLNVTGKRSFKWTVL